MRILKYYIKYLIILFSCNLFCQNQVKNDTVNEYKYGFRVGIDISKQIRTLIEDNYKGIEFVGDYRLTKNLYLASEIGNENKHIDLDALKYNSSGTYIKIGTDYNVYKNWTGMDNQIIVGFRFGRSQHKKKLFSYNVLDYNNYWNEDNRVTLNDYVKHNNLNANWAELQFGVKTEIINNFFMGISLQVHYLISDKDPTNFENLFIPGFNKVLTNNRYGSGINYTISYRLPLYKK